MTVTIYDVARVAGVSPATVSRALSGARSVSVEARSRIEAAVERLDYRPNGVARSLALRSTRTIALLVPDITNPFFPALVKGAQDAADERRYTLLLSNTAGDASKEVSYLKALREQLVEGAILVGVVAKRRAILEAIGIDVPTVSLDRGVDLPSSTFVHLDNVGAAYLATRHLLDFGHRRIAHISGPAHLEVSEQRAEGYRRALAEAGIGSDGHLILAAEFSEEGGHAVTERLLTQAPSTTAIFAANDLMAIGAMAALRERGLKVPTDISVVGFDDIHLSRYVSPALTTIHQPTYEMGRAAAEILISALETGEERSETMVFHGELVVRDSTGPVKRGLNQVPRRKIAP